MEITFKERPISEAPLAVLKHLYYYTTQYGLSVKQFTGAHWDYWEKLPERLRKAQKHPKEIESIIRELEDLAKGSKERLQKRREQIKGRKWGGKWAEKEIILNAQLLSVLGALPDRLLAAGFRKVIGSKNLPPKLQIVDLIIKGEKGEDKDFVEPDLLLLGEQHLLMVEVKTRGSEESSRDYPPNQLLNYLQLMAKCLDLGDNSLPKQFIHLILVPSSEPCWLENHKKWVLELRDNEGKLKVDPDACIRMSKRKKSYLYENLKNLINETPIYYRSWQELSDGFESAIHEYAAPLNHKHWVKIIDEVKELAIRAGQYK